VKYDFDRVIERRGTDSIKWGLYPRDIIPLWVADMDFRSAEPIVQALRNRSNHGIFGYGRFPAEFIPALQNRLRLLYGWDVAEPEIVFIPGIVTGLNIAIQSFTSPGEGVLAQPPVYFHLLRDPVHHSRILQDPPLIPKGDTYEIDFDLFERAITRDTKLFLFCNPHNPVGRVYTKVELEKIAEICLRYGLIICSDEIHCDLIYPPHQHIPIATLSREMENRTITLMAPSKTYNIAGLECGYAIIKNEGLRKRWKEFSFGLIPNINIMGQVAALTGLQEGQDWLDQVLIYLKGNRDLLEEFFKNEIPSIRMSRVEATYLAWLDCSKLGIVGKLSEFFMKKAGVALNDGTEFGKGGENFIRLNFACPQKKLLQALQQIKKSLEIL
jgi:cystathionine beta-lyase